MRKILILLLGICFILCWCSNETTNNKNNNKLKNNNESTPEVVSETETTTFAESETSTEQETLLSRDKNTYTNNITYETVWGNELTVPFVVAVMIDLNENSLSE